MSVFLDCSPGLKVDKFFFFLTQQKRYNIYNETQKTQIRSFLVYFINLFIIIILAYFIDHRTNTTSGKLASGKLTLVLYYKGSFFCLSSLWRGGIPRWIGWGDVAHFPKPLAYLRPHLLFFVPHLWPEQNIWHPLWDQNMTGRKTCAL